MFLVRTKGSHTSTELESCLVLADRLRWFVSWVMIPEENVAESDSVRTIYHEEFATHFISFELVKVAWLL